MMKKIRNFTLIELVLALGLVLGGLIGLMSLFVVGAGNSTEAKETFYADVAAKNILNYVEFNLMHYSDSTGFFDSANSTGLYSLAGGAINVDLGKLPEERQENPSVTLSNPGTDLHDGVNYFPSGKVFVKGGDDDTCYTYVVKFTHTVHGDGGDRDNSDFYGVVSLWKEKVTPVDSIKALDLMPDYASAVRINAEISWPADAEYANRFKKVYSVEVINPNYRR